ncbi:MAG: FecR domain-containing protein [Bacteroidota bacterium]
MDKSNFDKLLKRYLSGQVTEEEKSRIEAWLEVMKTEDTTTMELSKEEEDKLFHKITAGLHIGKEPAGLPPVGPKHVLFTPWRMGIAATLLILSISFVMWNMRGNVSEGTGVKKMILSDGTLVWLRGESKLVYHERSNESIRYAELNGEALFEVAKDPQRPFMIRCGELTIKVLGTSFSVRTIRDSLELEVLTGKVNLSSANDKTGIDVESHQKVIYSLHGELVKTEMNAEDVSVATARTEYNMEFRNTSLEQVIDKVEKKFNVTINVGNEEINKCRITADFTDHSLASTLEMMAEVLDFEYKIDGNSVEITGSGCN